MDDSDLKVMVLHVLANGVQGKAVKIVQLVNEDTTHCAVKKKDVNRVLYALERECKVQKGHDQLWKLVAGHPLGDVPINPCPISRQFPAEKEHEDCDEVEVNSDDLQCRIKSFIYADPGRNFETKEIVSKFELSKREINKCLYALKNQNIIQMVAPCVWIANVPHPEDTFDGAAPYEETDGLHDDPRNQHLEQRNRRVSGGELLYDVYPDIDDFLMENMWPGPLLLAGLIKAKYITSEMSKKAQDTKGVHEKCQLITASLRKNKHSIRIGVFAKCLQENGQSFISEMLLNTVDQAMPKRDKEILTRNITQFLGNTTLDTPLLQYLYQEHVINEDMKEEIVAQDGKNAKVLSLLVILQRCGKQALPGFRKALEFTQQGYTARFCDKIM